MTLEITRTKLMSVLKSPYLVYPAGIIAIILFYADIFLLLQGEFNVRNAGLMTALYWVVVTMTTTGFGDIYPVTPLGKIFTMLVILTGVAIFFAVILPLMVTPIMERMIKSPGGKPPGRLQNHVIVCGFNALVDSLIHELAEAGRQFVVIDESAERVRKLQLRGHYALHGDATDEDILEAAHIREASTLIANEGDDRNAAIVLTASQLAECKIIALVEKLDMAEYLKFAGADIVVSPKQVLGINMGLTAISAINFEVTNVVGLAGGVKICKLPVYPDNPMVGKKFKDLRIRENTGAAVIAAFKDGKLVVNPPPSMEVDEATVLMAVGDDRQLHEMGSLARVRGAACADRRIIAGFGDVGKEVARQFDKKSISYAIIDLKPYPGTDQVLGDATDKETLLKAGIKEASTLIVTLNDDNKNMLTVLLARNLNPHVNIIARANLDRSVGKLYRAGADYVTSLSTTGGQILARIVEKGAFEDTVVLSGGVLLEKFKVKGSGIEGKSIKDTMMLTRTGCTIVGVIEDGKFTPNPDPALELGPDSVILTVGTFRQLESCAAAFGLDRAAG